MIVASHELERAGALATRSSTSSAGRMVEEPGVSELAGAPARLVAGKDLRIERRSRVALNQVLPFAGVTMVMFAFALDRSAADDDTLLERSRPA